MTKKPLVVAVLALAFCVQVGMQTSEAQQSLDIVRAAEAGDAHAQFEVGKMNLKLEGRQYKQRALEQFKKAAAQGHSGASYYSAVMYERGLGVAKNRKQAITFYQRAANAGNPDAMYTLSKMYDEGVGDLKKDPKKAREWYDKALTWWDSGVTTETVLRHKN